MVTALRSLTVAALALCASSAFGRCTPGSEFEPSLCPFRLPPVARIVIEENAAKSALEPDAALSCASFRVDERLVLRYLRRARLVDPATAHSTLLWSPCYAAGRLTLRDGRQARWQLTQFGVGWLRIGAGEEHTLYCPACRERPFVR
jgi:hypothetical protein